MMTNPRINWRVCVCPECGRALVYEQHPPQGGMKIGIYRCKSGHSVAVHEIPVWLAS